MTSRINTALNPAVLGLLAIWAGVTAAAHAQPAGGYRVPDLVTQFSQINYFGDAMGFNRGVAEDAMLCKHYQTVCRVEGAGQPYLILVRSGNDTGACEGAGDDPGELIVVRMDSRGSSGERLRSNKLQLDSRFADTAPYSQDAAVGSYRFDGHDDGDGQWPPFCHPGGSQIVDDVMFVAMEHNWATGTEQDGGILLLDVSNPEDIAPIKFFDMDTKIGVTAVTLDPDTGRYLLLMTGGSFDSGEYCVFYETSSGNLHDPNLTLNYLGAWNSDTDPDPGDDDKWGTGSLEWQNINFVRDTNGDLYAICLDNATMVTTSGDDWARLFRVLRTTNGNQHTFDLDFVAERNLKLNDETGPHMGDLDAGAGVYVSPTGQLIIYTCEHDNDGPEGSIRMGEFRNYNMNNSGTDFCNGWITIYETTYGWDDDGAKSATLDWQDRALEEWNNLSDFEDFSSDPDGWNDEAESVRWCIPPGRFGMLYAAPNLDPSEGEQYLDGTGHVMWISDLNTTQVRRDWLSSLVIKERQPNMYVIPETGGGAGGFGEILNPYYGSTSIQYAADRMGAPPCFNVQTIFIAGGTYNQRISIDRAMTLASWNGQTVTIIGQ